MTQNNSLPALISKMEPEFKKTLGNMVPSERFTRIAVTAVKSNPDIAQLERTSLMASIMKAAQDGLVIDGKEAAIVPFKGKATYIPMVAGMVKKIRQHTDFANISHGIIYQSEYDAGLFEYVKGDNEYLTHKPMLFGDRGNPIGAYAIVTTKDGQKFRAVLTKDEIEKRMKAGRASNNGPWQTWTEEMWIKTAIRAVYKIAPNSGDGGGVLDHVFGRDDEEPSDVQETPAAEPGEEAKPKRTRAASKVIEAEAEYSSAAEADAPPPESEHDADGVVDTGESPPPDDDNLPL